MIAHKNLAKKHILSSFSLIEVLVFVSILSIFFVSALAVVTASIRNMTVNQHKIMATRYAEELLGWLEAKKEIDWNTLYEKAGSTNTLSYCFNSLDNTNFTWNPSSAPCTSYLALIYKREVSLKQNTINPANVNVDITVSWQDFGVTHSVPVNTVFSVWEGLPN